VGDNVTAGQPTTPLFEGYEEAIASGQGIAENFVRNDATFKFDGIQGSIRLLETGPGFSDAYRSWIYTFEFQDGHPGYGDRSGQFLEEVITTHRASILVNIEGNITVRWAVCDGTWDMLRQKDLPVYVSGVVIGGGDITPPGGPLDAPHLFIYKILRDRGDFIDVSYTAYPPSPAAANITLDFYGGEIRVGDKIDALGSIDKQTGTLVVAEMGNFIRTSVPKATVLGAVVGIDATGAPERYVYELLREDGTFVKVSHTPGDAALSLYNETIRIGDYMKAVGTYDKSTNTIILAGPDNMVKTYSYRPLPGE
jgi:hypothetical protein